MSLSAGNGPRKSEGDRQRTYNEVVILHGCLPFLAFFIRQQLLLPLDQHVRTETRTKVGRHYHQDCLLSSLQLNGIFKLYKDKVRTAVGVVSVLQMGICVKQKKNMSASESKLVSVQWPSGSFDVRRHLLLARSIKHCEDVNIRLAGHQSH